MPAAEIKTKDELIQEIKERITVISGTEEGRPVNLENVHINDSSRTGCGGKIAISCLFINDEGNVCTDMYRSGSAGCVDFICGLTLDSADEKVLKAILTALEENRWSVADYQVKEKQKKRTLVSSLKMPFSQKGA